MWIGLTTYLGTVSTYNLASISVDRLVACLKSIQYKATNSNARVISLITASWTVPLVPLLILFGDGDTPVRNPGKFYGRRELYFRASVIFVGFVIPPSVIAFTGVHVLRAKTQWPVQDDR